MLLHSIAIAIQKPIFRKLPIPTPRLIDEVGGIKNIHNILMESGGKKPFIVTDKTLVDLGLIDEMLTSLSDAEIDYFVFSEVKPDPDFGIVRKGVELYKSNNCDSMIIFGGGSPIDCGKAIGASITTKKDISKLSGLLKVRKKLPPFIAIPTTAGTGSETTGVAVISDLETKQKLTVVDPNIVPHIALIDPTLMTGLPPKITAETGVDALTHGIESYIGKFTTQFTETNSIAAITDIMTYLKKAYDNGSDIQARHKMAVASYKAGLAFTRASVGYVHAMAHQIGAFYHVPHGLANAVILPHILDFSYEAAYPKYALLARKMELASSSEGDREAATKFLNTVKELLTDLNIPKGFPALKQEDIPTLAQRAIAEANMSYPVPVQMTQKQCEDILISLMIDE